MAQSGLELLQEQLGLCYLISQSRQKRPFSFSVRYPLVNYLALLAHLDLDPTRILPPIPLRVLPD